jgi:hypothetical protein
MNDSAVTELVVSPRWAVTVGDIDGTPHVVLRIVHPRLGPLDYLLPNNDAIELAAALEKTWERRDEKRMSRRAPGASNSEVAQLRQPARRSFWAKFTAFRKQPA